MLNEFEAREVIDSYNNIYKEKYLMIDYWTSQENRNEAYNPYE
jgi:hypothetical protein